MSNNSTPDLTQRPPRSPRVRLGGYVLLPRILDKGRASLAGKLGEYRYAGKGMDRHFFNFVGLDHEALKAELAKGAAIGKSSFGFKPTRNISASRGKSPRGANIICGARRTAMPKRSRSSLKK